MNQFEKYRDAGFCVIPVSEVGLPLVKWSQYMDILPSDECASWVGDYALICGAVSGVVGIDIDTDDETVIAQVEAMAGKSPLKKRGSKGFTAFYKYNGDENKSWKRNGIVTVELLSDKRLCTIPPSLHRKTGKKYVWLEGAKLTKDLPLLPTNFSAVMNALFGVEERIKLNESWVSPHDSFDMDISQAEEMLGYISPDISYHEWIAVGMALRDEFGDGGFSLWDGWSSKGSGYKAAGMRHHWRSFNGTGVGIGTLVYFAKDGGWYRKFEDIEIDLSYLDKKSVKEVEKIELKAHGLVGEIADWITSTAISPQPILSLAAALSFVGVLKAHRYATYRGSRTNLLVLSLAPTGSGKEHPQYCIRELMQLAGMEKYILGQPTSGTAFLTGLHKNKGKGLLIKDEAGRYLGNAMNAKSGNYEKEIVDYIISSFSRANSIMEGKQYANEKMNPKIDIVQPHFCLLGSSVKEHVIDACSSKHAIDGLLNRFLIFESSEWPEDGKGKMSPPPQQLLEKIIALVNQPIEYDYNGRPEVRVVDLSPEARDIMAVYTLEIKKRQKEAGYPLDALYARLIEHVYKVALTLCDNEMVGVTDINLAIKIIEQSFVRLVNFAGLIADNPYEAGLIRLREVIKEAGKKGITKSELTRRTQWIGGERKRNEGLADLLGSNLIRLEKLDKTIVFYYNK
jgi:hypothetical protein